MDVVVTVPRSFGLDTWIEEGDPAGSPWSGEEWDFYLYGKPPQMTPWERVYVVYNGVLRGYAPLVRIQVQGQMRYARDEDGRLCWPLGKNLARYFGPYSLVRHGGAVACTIAEFIPGFRGWKSRWWERAAEVPFPEWEQEWALPQGVIRPRPLSKKSQQQTSRLAAVKVAAPSLWGEG